VGAYVVGLSLGAFALARLAAQHEGE